MQVEVYIVIEISNLNKRQCGKKTFMGSSTLDASPERRACI